MTATAYRYSRNIPMHVGQWVKFSAWTVLVHRKAKAREPLCDSNESVIVVIGLEWNRMDIPLDGSPPPTLWVDSWWFKFYHTVILYAIRKKYSFYFSLFGKNKILRLLLFFVWFRHVCVDGGDVRSSAFGLRCLSYIRFWIKRINQSTRSANLSKTTWHNARLTHQKITYIMMFVKAVVRRSSVSRKNHITVYHYFLKKTAFKPTRYSTTFLG